MNTSFYNTIIESIDAHFKNDELVKVYVKNNISNQIDYNWILIKPILIQEEKILQFVYKYETKDITKNYSMAEAKEILSEELLSSFRSINIFTPEYLFQFDTKDNKKLQHKVASDTKKASLNHDKEKSRLIPIDSLFLKQLGITTTKGEIRKKYRSKFIQINRFIEILKPYLSSTKLKAPISISDMGCGKGYLTFALHHYLTEKLKKPTGIKGIEQRAELVSHCNNIISELGLEGIDFLEGSIDDHNADCDILIALHACDTATDDAIMAGISSEAQLIVCSPCCHKALRKRIKHQGPMKSVLKEGIVLERQSELLTDAIRKLILEYNGYKVSIMEFVATEHTAKNLLLIAEKKNKDVDPTKLILLKELKSMWGIDGYYLEEKLELI